MTELDYNFVISRNLSLSKITNTNILVVDSSAYANKTHKSEVILTSLIPSTLLLLPLFTLNCIVHHLFTFLQLLFHMFFFFFLMNLLCPSKLMTLSVFANPFFHFMFSWSLEVSVWGGVCCSLVSIWINRRSHEVTTGRLLCNSC